MTQERDPIELQRTSFLWSWLRGVPPPILPHCELNEELAHQRVRQRMLGRQGELVVGRYQIEASIGRGGGGSVFVAYDPNLQRQVAIKVVPAEGERDRSRALLEAQSLAALSHPGVVDVFDFGVVRATADDAPPIHGVYVVMEYLRGSTLRGWLASERRSIPQILDLFGHIARGLQAAHDVGIVHRDVKPENIVVVADDAAKLVDFGLAWRDPTWSTQSGDSISGPGASTTLRARRPLPAVIGTPLYMAPEQHCAEPATPAADQFALAVTLYEAILGVPPFFAEDVEGLYEAKMSGQLDSGSGAPELAPRLMAPLRKAMAALPEDRHASVMILMSRLQAAARPRRLSRTAKLVLGAAGAGAVAVPLAALTADAAPGGCADEVRSPLRSGAGVDLDALGERLVARGLPASAAWRRIEPQLRAFETTWFEAREQACAADLDPRAFDRRMQCLKRIAAQSGTVVEVLETADDKTIRGAAATVRDLPDAGSCVGASAEVDDSEMLARIDALDLRLARAIARLRSSVAPDAVEDASAVVEEARRLGHTPLVARGLNVLGRLQLDLAQTADGEASLYEAIWLAMASDQQRLAAQTVPRYLYSLIWQSKYDEAEAFGPHAAEILDGADASARLRARVAVEFGQMNVGRSEPKAMEALTQARELLEAGGLEVSEDYSDVLTGLGTLARHRGDLDEALGLMQRALETIHAAVGEEAPSTAYVHERVGGIHHLKGDLDAAQTHYERCIAIMEQNYGPDYPDLAWPTSVLAMIWLDRGQHDDAARAVARARGIAARTIGERSDLVAVISQHQSMVERTRGNYEASLRAATNARDIHAEVSGPRALDVANAEDDRGRALEGMGDAPGAVAAYSAALDIYDEVGNVRMVGKMSYLLAGVYISQRQWARAESAARRTLEVARGFGESSAEFREADERLQQVLAAQRR